MRKVTKNMKRKKKLKKEKKEKKTGSIGYASVNRPAVRVCIVETVRFGWSGALVTWASEILRRYPPLVSCPQKRGQRVAMKGGWDGWKFGSVLRGVWGRLGTFSFFLFLFSFFPFFFPSRGEEKTWIILS